MRRHLVVSKALRHGYKARIPVDKTETKTGKNATENVIAAFLKDDPSPFQELAIRAHEEAA